MALAAQTFRLTLFDIYVMSSLIWSTSQHDSDSLLFLHDGFCVSFPEAHFEATVVATECRSIIWNFDLIKLFAAIELKLICNELCVNLLFTLPHEKPIRLSTFDDDVNKKKKNST